MKKHVRHHLYQIKSENIQSGLVAKDGLFYPVRMNAPRDAEPTFATAPELQDTLSELSRREPIFHRPEFGTLRADFERMTAEDFWETGASGRRYSRKMVLDELEKRFSVPHQDVWETSGFHCRRLSAYTYLLTYTLLQDKVRLTRRATIWRSTADGWKIVYHQGTIVQDI